MSPQVKSGIEAASGAAAEWGNLASGAQGAGGPPSIALNPEVSMLVPASVKITPRLDHVSHGKRIFGTHWSNRWTYQLLIINTRRDYIPSVSFDCPACFLPNLNESTLPCPHPISDARHVIGENNFNQNYHTFTLM